MMKDIGSLFQTADWKTEKHVPVIELPSGAAAGQPLTVSVSVGKEVPHPNKTEHHIEWIDICFLPEGEKFPYHLGRFEFKAHGASVQGPDTSTIYTEPKASVTFKTDKAGTVLAVSYCNIHGLWANSEELTL